MQKLLEAPDRKYEQRTGKRKGTVLSKRSPFLFSAADTEE